MLSLLFQMMSTTTTTVGSSWFYLQKEHLQSKQQCWMPNPPTLLNSSPELPFQHPEKLQVFFRSVVVFCLYIYIHKSFRPENPVVWVVGKRAANAMQGRRMGILDAIGERFRQKDRIFTLLHWILHVSNVVCESSGYLCFNENSSVSALSAKTWFLSVLSVSDMRSLTMSHEDFEWAKHAFFLHVYMEASTLSASSSASCSELIFRLSRRYSGENFSAAFMYR